MTHACVQATHTAVCKATGLATSGSSVRPSAVLRYLMTKLADWLLRERLTPEQLRRMLGVKNRSTVMRWLTGARVPGAEMLQKINDITQGEVTIEDFLDPSPPKCAEVILDLAGNPKLVFPWTPGREVQAEAYKKVRTEPREGDRWSDPITKAMEVLGNRVRFTKRGLFLLDGRVTDARGVVREANKVLDAFGRPQLPYPGVKGTDE